MIRVKRCDRMTRCGSQCKRAVASRLFKAEILCWQHKKMTLAIDSALCRLTMSYWERSFVADRMFPS